MNHAYRLVFNRCLNAWIAVAETAKSRGKGGCCKVSTAVALVFALTPFSAFALPAGGQIVVGSGTISQSGNTMTITQTSQNMAANWTSFSIAKPETVNTVQPNSSAIALFRVLGSDPSRIDGIFNANGQVFLLNPNGILFGKTAQVNVGGLVVSTLSLSDADFMAKNYRFTGSAGSLVNQGSINVADKGYAVLLGGQVSNQGTIVAKLGNVSLAAGKDITLDFAGDQLINVQVNQGTLSALAENKQLIVADGGTVLLTAKAADALISAVVNNEGVIEARTVSNQGGTIRLAGDEVAGIVSNTGTLESTQVSTSGRSVLQAGTVNANNADLKASFALIQTAAGSVNANILRLDGGQHSYVSGSLSGQDVTVAGDAITLAGATVTTGDNGRIRIGGGAHGADGNIANARTVSITESTQVTAGNNAQVVVWSDKTTNYFGNIVTGDNAFVEVSSKGTLNLGGTVKTGAHSQVLYDPIDIVIDATAPASFYLDLANPNPAPGNNHGNDNVVELANGNIVVSSGNDIFGGSNAGAAYLYNGKTGTLISALYGSHANDYVGGGITTLTNGSYVVSSPDWNGGMGAATWGSGTSGASGVVTATNSLVGSSVGDYVGNYGITALTNGNYVVSSASWNGGLGAVTWGSGTAGVSGAVSAANSLVGSTTNDQVGNYGITELANGNYVVSSTNWNGGMGAATWGSGTAGVSGVVSSANSLVGANAGDHVGAYGITALTNGNYVVRSGTWNSSRGAVTWGSGTTGISGVVSASNSLVGSTTNDLVGSYGIIELANGNYVVRSSNWNGGMGAVTWGSGMAGVSGTVSAANSLVGSSVGDYVGAYGIIELANGNYLVRSPDWNGGTGAVTWGRGTAGVSGTVSAGNSLVGSSVGDYVGNYGIIRLTNGNYVVVSSNWNSNRGAVTWGSGTAGVSGAVSATNSLIGTSANDHIGSSGITALTNGNYVVGSGNWNGGWGAATWGSGTMGVTGTVSSTNSLIGSVLGDVVGSDGVTALTNGNYVVNSANWNGGRGAVTWGNGSTGVSGTVSAANSLVGSTAGDRIGIDRTVALANGNYVVNSLAWNGYRGAVTWGSGTTGVSGVVSVTNSLVGENAGDLIGVYGITTLANGNYVVNSNYWNGGMGAVTWGSGTAGVSGVVSAANSLVGSTAGDLIGSNGITVLANGNYVVGSSNWNGNRGAVTWGSGTAGVSGVVSATNSLVGTTMYDYVGSNGIVTLANGNYVVGSSNWNGNRGAVTWGSATAGVSGVVSATNSLVGSTENDWIGSNGITELASGNYLVVSPDWNSSRGAVTWGSGTGGVSGVVSSVNSLVGANTNDNVGSYGITTLTNGNYLVVNPVWNDNQGAVWLVADASNLGTLASSSAVNAAVSPAALANAAGAGSTVTLQASHDITVNSAVVVAGKLNLVAGNTVTLNAGLTSTATGDALVLSGNRFVNNAGANALSTPRGRWLVYSAAPTGNTLGGLSADGDVWGATYAANAPTTIVAGKHFVYASAASSGSAYQSALASVQALPPVMGSGVANVSMMNAGMPSTEAPVPGTATGSAEGGEHSSEGRRDSVVQLANLPLFAQPLPLQVINGGMRLPLGLDNDD
jgi:filamentous hemagglutinin family protein